MAVVIAGERSGAGKTTVTLALLAALRRRSQEVQSFKVGPDYIDPMFHSHVTGKPCRNLDPVLTSEAYVRQCFARNIQNAEYALIEGVMGLFDGASGTDDYGSTAHMARLLDLPVLLILNCSSLSRSIAAIAHGYRTFDPRINVAGVILNRVGSDRHLELLQSALEPLQLPIFGVLRRQDEISIPDRHLGLIPTGELNNLKPIIDRLAYLGETCFDWAKLLPLLTTLPQLSPIGDGAQRIAPLRATPRIAIARDSAFNFYYADNLELFEQMGAELIEWSPLEDSSFPKGVQGLYFGGGFPEVFAAQLTENQTARQAVQAAIKTEIPTYAECGGLMYLCEEIVDFAGKSYPMVGVLPTTAMMGKRLTLGYRQATATQDSPLVKKGDRFWGHEFHRSTLTNESPTPLLNLKGYNSQISLRSEGWQCDRVHASYTHVHFGAQPQLLERFLRHCTQFRGDLQSSRL
ncbi:cobyrinate a,c-diamide synthase [Merismopedia glauca]|uniref:Cobyrinate a,c-diamide synthase n=1 Tax=Merismopedia glauca CCAP 1448/3 TaxID=1296344 RepID=A0A2T1C320_9CYAN|nr:cobyrinate a,c-diamide synthase [Merismopedia glauca]PSB02513.1 cobyrinic acid a,c-diamide synthase [Merismopedia glauca CCAP 1448/3]